MASYRGKRRTKTIAAGITGALVFIFVILYILDSVFGLGNVEVEAECEMHFLDVGQGDCTMIITEDATVVVDAGPGDHADSTLKYIKSYTDSIDYLILTHPHEDHIGGADELIESIHVENVIMSDASTDTVVFTRLLDTLDESGVNLIEAEAGESFEAGEIKMTILSPLSELKDLNDYSVVTKIEYGDTSVIVTGDVENHSERLMVKEYSYYLRADIFQVGHHGSYTSNSEKFIDAISPEYAVITCGKNNEYGHPHRETLEKLDDRNIEYFRTDELGHIVFVSDGENVQYKDQ